MNEKHFHFSNYEELKNKSFEFKNNPFTNAFLASDEDTCCKKCGCKSISKNGKSSVLNQKYKCNQCGHTFTKYDGRTKIERHKKRLAVFFTHYELKFSKEHIALFLKVKEKTIFKWIEQEEKAFKDDEYLELMIDFRNQNHYYVEICKIHNKMRVLNKEFYYDNGNGSKISKKDRFKTPDIFESAIIDGKAIYSREKVNANLAYVSQFLKENEKKGYIERMNHALKIGRLVIIDSGSMKTKDVIKMFKTMKTTQNDLKKTNIENLNIDMNWKVLINEVQQTFEIGF